MQNIVSGYKNMEKLQKIDYYFCIVTNKLAKKYINNVHISYGGF